MKDPRDIILAPVVSEKSYALIEQGVYTFKVHPSASKPEISATAAGDAKVAAIAANTTWAELACANAAAPAEPDAARHRVLCDLA